MPYIQRNDTVIVIAGKYKGKTGRVLRILNDKDRVLVERVGVVKKHVKPNPQADIKGGNRRAETPIHLSNVMLIDGTGKPTGGIREVNGKRERYARRTGETLGTEEEVKRLAPSL